MHPRGVSEPADRLDRVLPGPLTFRPSRTRGCSRSFRATTGVPERAGALLPSLSPTAGYVILAELLGELVGGAVAEVNDFGLECLQTSDRFDRG